MQGEVPIEVILQSPEIGELAAALAAAQGEFEPAAKDRVADIKSDKGAYSYKYADLAACLTAVRQPLSRNGLAVLQRTEFDGREILLRTDLLHKSGQWIASRFPLPIGEKTWDRSQNVGSLITFYRRYTLCALLQIATEDDDGAAAMPPPLSNRREDDRRPRRDDRRERRPEQPAATKPTKAEPPFDGKPIDYEAWLVDYCERVNRHWLDAIENIPNPAAKMPAEIMSKFHLNNHLIKALGIRVSKDWPVNLDAGYRCWETSREGMIAEAKVKCRHVFDAELAKLKPPAREPGSDDMPSPDEEALLDRMVAEKAAAGKAVGNA